MSYTDYLDGAAECKTPVNPEDKPWPTEPQYPARADVTDELPGGNWT